MITMRIGITCRFQNSYFSGSTPQIACTLGRALKELGHDVSLLYPKGESSWFIDIQSELPKFPARKEWTSAEEKLDLIVEVCWAVPIALRSQAASRIALFHHYPPTFHDMESSVYPFNPSKREFENATEVWTWSHYGKQDIHYLEFLSGKPVYTIPYIVNFDAVDAYIRETNVPFWKDTAKMIDSKVTGDVPASLAWSARIVESNQSNSSHCLIPLNIVSEIRRVNPIRFSVHNGEQVVNNAFFGSNVAKNLLIPDLSGNFVPRVRLPDLCREKSFLISHQRFRPIKGFLVDALYMGIPVIHNCQMLKDFGYMYELNQIRQAVGKWHEIIQDYQSSKGFFESTQYTARRQKLRQMFGLSNASDGLRNILSAAPTPVSKSPFMKIEEIVTTSSENEIRVAFCDMWDQFNPEHNFFMSLLKWVGSQHSFTVKLDSQNPTLVIYSPFGETHQAYQGVPKIFFTGENAPPKTDHDTFLNLGFRYMTESNYVRLPLWVLEINWFGEDPDKIVNPRPVSLEACLKQDPAVIEAKEKFCAFVATNPKCQNRNVAFHILNQWRGVDSGGRLFCNLPSGPIPAGLGGGGGELSKVDFYKKYKYAITYENESCPGYTTEKIFHAKVAGCVPIYWGDKFVDRDFDSHGFLNANTVSTPQELIELVDRLEKDPEAWKKAASVPALSEYKRHWCERTMEEMSKQIVRKLFEREITFATDAWKNSTSFSSAPQPVQPHPLIQKEEEPAIELPTKRRIVTAANAKFIQSSINLFHSIRKFEPSTPVRLYVWNDIPDNVCDQIRGTGIDVVRFPLAKDMGWSDYWDPQHYAWKIWIYSEESKNGAADECVLYIDSGIEVVHPLDTIWRQIQKHGMSVLEDNEQINRRWCHPTFCEALKVSEEELVSQQILAGFIGFKPHGPYHEPVFMEALKWSMRREVITGDKWRPYSATCMGHRHDQSILSVLTHRARVPRLQHRDFYCDRSKRTAENWGTPLYVHRGSPRILVPVAPGIDEAYVINLAHRKDRLESFKQNQGLKDVTYVWKATNGRDITMNPDLAYLFRNNDFKWKKSVMGCAISHMGLWEKLANDPVAKSYLIMEDDVRFHNGWLAKWMSISSKIPADTDVIYLGGVLPPNKAALPSITEPVNDAFARVAKNHLFGPADRRYFHFCNYSYILTQSGARKLCNLIKERGIFTSGDHMIVNHGDSLMNIYFTTPLLTECIQENDPVYVKSDFNNFARLDTFDSDLWNNNDHFTQEEITPALAKSIESIEIKVVKEPISEEELKRLNEEHARKLMNQVEVAQPAQPQPQPQAQVQAAEEQPTMTKEQKITLWNDFLRATALRKSDEVEKHMTTIFESWKTHEDILTDVSWFRVFEQLILTSHPEISKHKDKIVQFIQSRKALSETVWTPVLKHFGVGELKNTNTVASYVIPQKKVAVYHLAGIDPPGFFELDWFNKVFPHEIEWIGIENVTTLVEASGIPTLLYFTPAGRNMSAPLQAILSIFQQLSKQLILFHMSDEFSQDDISVYNHPSVKHVIRNYWRTGIDRSKVTVIPLGYAKGRSSIGLPEPPSFTERESMWSFVGSADRPGRKEALESLHVMTPYVERVKTSWSTPMIVEAHEYCDILRKSKFVPCMKGSVAMESFRMYEALEHGAIPFYVPSESNNCADEYREIFGASPLMSVPSWKDAGNYLAKLAERPDIMETHRRDVMNWWKEQKEQFREKLRTLLAA